MLEPNDHRLPLGSRIYPILVKSFNAQGRLVLDRLAGRKSMFYTPAELLRPSDPGLVDELEAIVPQISMIWDAGGKRLRSEVGLDPERWRVTSEFLRSAIRSATLSFAESTQASFAEAFRANYEATKAQIRAEIDAGRLQAGETTDQLSKRLRKYFQDSNRFRARRIAQTEATRAHHQAKEWSAIDSQVVVGWEWVTTSASCKICDAIAKDMNNPSGRRRIRLGQNFAVIGNDPKYKDIRFGPAHPHCRCTIRAILDAVHSGDPTPVSWSQAWTA